MLKGKITLRQFRVMVQGLGPDTPVGRALYGPWTDLVRLTHDIDSQLRILNTALSNIFRAEGAPPSEPTLIPTPEQDTDDVTPDVNEAERAELLSLTRG